MCHNANPSNAGLMAVAGFAAHAQKAPLAPQMAYASVVHASRIARENNVVLMGAVVLAVNVIKGLFAIPAHISACLPAKQTI